MLQIQRQKEILKKLQENPALLTKELAGELKVSEMTIRRDFNDLMQQGLLVREHGGAVLPPEILNQLNEESKFNTNIASKEAIAKAAVELVKEGDCIFLDSGTTSLALLPLLAKKRVTIVIHSDLTLRNLVEIKAEIILLGGSYSFAKFMTYGPLCLEALKSFTFNISFFSCIAIDLTANQVFSSDINNGQIKASALERSSCKVLLADYSKFRQRGFYRCAGLQEFDYLITDYNDEKLNKYKERTTIKIVAK